MCVLFMSLTYYLPIVGKPFLSMGFVIAVNALNIILDIVFIRGFHMGCEGAALATLVSYIIVFIVMLFLLRLGNIPLTLCRIHGIRQSTWEIVKKGLPSGSVQAGYLITTIFCNHCMNLAFGLNSTSLTIGALKT